jgi:hypothetical protein
MWDPKRKSVVEELNNVAESSLLVKQITKDSEHYGISVFSNSGFLAMQKTLTFIRIRNLFLDITATEYTSILEIHNNNNNNNNNNNF